MNGFHSAGRDISAHESARTGAKKTANSIEGKTMRSNGVAVNRLQGTFAAAMKPVHWRRVAPLVVLIVSLVAAAPAAAGCGGVQKRVPPRRHWYLPPLVVGDSVLLGAMPQAVKAGFEVNTRGGHAWDEGDRVLWIRRHTHSLPHLVVMFLGADWTVSMRQIRYALHIVGHKRGLVLVTPREVGGYGGSDAANMRRAGRRYPDRVLVLD